MSDDHFNYDQLMLEAHRGLIRKVLQQVEQTGLPGEHHFFIIFSTNHQGTRISDRLRAQYPQEMTIVLQHQYSNLKIYQDRFEIQLSFNRIPELLVVPFAAITGFVDPSVPFGLQLVEDPANGLENSIGMLVPGLPQTSKEPHRQNESTAPEAVASKELGAFDDDVDFWDGEETSVPSVFASKKPLHEVKSETVELVLTDESPEDEEEEAPTANIVQLDAFRKKSK